MQKKKKKNFKKKKREKDQGKPVCDQVTTIALHVYSAGLFPSLPHKSDKVPSLFTCFAQLLASSSCDEVLRSAKTIRSS